MELLDRAGKNRLSLDDNCITFIDYVGGENAIYIGQAAPGKTDDDKKWKIKKLAYDGNDNVTSIKFASGKADFRHAWALRASYTYS